MHLNFLQPPAASWTLGDLDITPIVVDFAVRQPIAEIATPLIWSGDLSLAQRLGPPFSESLHELENPLRWERGQHPLEVRFWGAKFCTLRIAEYFYDEDTFTARAGLTDILGLIDYRSPPAECEGIQVGTQNSWESAVQILLLQGSQIDGVAYLSEERILFDSGLPTGFYESPIIKTGSYIKTAQEIAGAHGCFLWVDADENVRISAYPVTPPAPLNILNRAQVDLYQRQPAPEGPFDKVIVTGTKEAVCNCAPGDPPPIETFGVFEGQKIVTSRETRTTKQSTSDKLVIGVKKEQILGDLFPEEHKGKITMVISEQAEEIHYYDAEGRTQKIVTRKDLPRGIAVPDIPKYKGSYTLILDAEKTEEEFFYGNASSGTREAAGGSGIAATDDGVCHRKLLTTWGRFPVTVDASMDIFDDASYSGLIIREEVEERWTQNPAPQDPEKPPCLRWRYVRTTKRRQLTERTTNIIRDGETQTTTRKGPGALAVVSTEPSEDSTPSGGPTREPDAPMGTVALMGEATLSPVNYQTFAPRQSEVNVGWLTSNAGAQYLAELLAKLQWQRRFCRFISHPIYEWFALGWRPFVRIDVHLGSWIVDGLAVACAGGEAEFSWIGNLLGTIPEIPIPPEPPTWRPQPQLDTNGQPILDVNGQYTYALQIGPLPTLSLIAGIPIAPVPVRVVGGTGTYTLAPTGLPAGLSIVDGFLVGTPTVTGSFSGQISVDDGTTTVATPAAGSTIPTPSPVPLVAVSMPLSARRVRISAFRVEDAFLAPDMVFDATRKRASNFELDVQTVRQVRTREAGIVIDAGTPLDATRLRMSNFYIGDISMIATRERSVPVESNPINVKQVRVRMTPLRDASAELAHISSSNPQGTPAVDGMEWVAYISGPPPRIVDWTSSGGVWTGVTRGGGIDGSLYGSPVGLTVPDYIDQQYFDGVTTWVATGTTDQDWSALTK